MWILVLFFGTVPIKLNKIKSNQGYKTLREGVHIDSITYRTQVSPSHHMSSGVVTTTNHSTLNAPKRDQQRADPIKEDKKRE